MFDTIVGISSALGVGAISIIRVSGKDSIKIINSIFSKDLNKVKTHTINYGKILDNNIIIDEVLISIMKSPKTFTTEDTVEINCHGGISTTNKILELILNKGARLADPGEFTKRAFLNNRIDLIEAESIMDLINSKTEISRKLAINGIEGKISTQIKELREKMVNIIANIEVNIDYPEYNDILIITNQMIKNNIVELENKLLKILKDSENGKIIKEGIKTLILGRPNVGKSSILNHLLEEEKAIVTNIEGTTRDVVEGTLNLNGIILNIVDTAGIRETKNIIENIGVKKSLDLIKESDLIILVLNNNEKLTTQDLKLLEITKEKNRIILINKCDLKSNLDRNELNVENIIEGNTYEDEGLKKLKEKIIEMFNLEKLEKEDLTYLSNARQISIVKETLKSLEDLKKGLKNQMPVDMLEIDLKNIWQKLGEIIGESYEEELVDRLFCQFCLGK